MLMQMTQAAVLGTGWDGERGSQTVPKHPLEPEQPLVPISIHQNQKAAQAGSELRFMPIPKDAMPAALGAERGVPMAALLHPNPASTAPSFLPACSRLRRSPPSVPGKRCQGSFPGGRLPAHRARGEQPADDGPAREDVGAQHLVGWVHHAADVPDEVAAQGLAVRGGQVLPLEPVLVPLLLPKPHLKAKGRCKGLKEHPSKLHSARQEQHSLARLDWAVNGCQGCLRSTPVAIRSSKALPFAHMDAPVLARQWEWEWDGCPPALCSIYPRGHEEQLGFHVGSEAAGKELAGCPRLQELEDTWEAGGEAHPLYGTSGIQAGMCLELSLEH